MDRSLKCTACGTENPADATFCENCGERIYRTCVACTADNPADSAFCDECGANLSPSSKQHGDTPPLPQNKHDIRPLATTKASLKAHTNGSKQEPQRPRLETAAPPQPAKTAKDIDLQAEGVKKKVALVAGILFVAVFVGPFVFGFLSSDGKKQQSATPVDDTASDSLTLGEQCKASSECAGTLLCAQTASETMQCVTSDTANELAAQAAQSQDPSVDTGDDQEMKIYESPYGTVKIVSTSSFENELHVDSNRVDFCAGVDDCSDAYIEKDFVLSRSVVYLLYLSNGGAAGRQTNLSCRFLELSDKGKHHLSELTYCPSRSKYRQDGDAVEVTFGSSAPYADDDDLGLIQYEGQRIVLVQKLKPEAYYRQKFAAYTAKQIVDEAIANDHFDKDNNQLCTAHACGGYGERYCYKFRAMQSPAHDAYYAILKKSCMTHP